jgi:hypothetical protein
VIMHLPRALEFELIDDDWFQVKVDGHVFIYRIEPDRLTLSRHRVKKGGRRAYRASEHYEDAALSFAWREAKARGLIRAGDLAASTDKAEPVAEQAADPTSDTALQGRRGPDGHGTGIPRAALGQASRGRRQPSR